MFRAPRQLLQTVREFRPRLLFLSMAQLSSSPRRSTLAVCEVRPKTRRAVSSSAVAKSAERSPTAPKVAQHRDCRLLNFHRLLGDCLTCKIEKFFGYAKKKKILFSFPKSVPEKVFLVQFSIVMFRKVKIF